jgi:FkbM family methyltransferase
MKSNRKISKRLQGLLRDLRSVAKIHGIKVLIAYVAVKLFTNIPLTASIVRKIFRGKLLMRVQILNSWMYLNLLDPGISYKLIVNGIREPGHVDQIMSTLRPGMNGIDLGANIGYYVLIESRLVGSGGRIYCIEPAPNNISLLKKNVSENNFDDRVTCFQYLIGDKNEPGRLFLSEAANSHSVAAISNRSVAVPMVTLDRFLAVNEIDPSEIDFLRMDIEGYEVMVFQHMQALLSNRKKPLKLFIELHPSSYEQWGWTLDRFIRYLMDLGFILKSVVEREKDEHGLINERAIGVENGMELADIFKRMIKKENEAGIIDNWFFEFLPRQ